VLRPDRKRSPEIAQILIGLRKRGGIKALEGDESPVAEKLAEQRRLLGRVRILANAARDRVDPLVERQAQQRLGIQAKLLDRLCRRTPAIAGKERQPPRQPRRTALDLGKPRAGKLRRPLQHLDAGHGRVERGGELGLRIHRLQPRAHHGNTGRGGGGHGSGRGHPHAPCKPREPPVGRLHLLAQTPEPALAGLAHAFELGAHLSATDGREADANAFLGHRSDSLLSPHRRLTFLSSIH